VALFLIGNQLAIAKSLLCCSTPADLLILVGDKVLPVSEEVVRKISTITRGALKIRQKFIEISVQLSHIRQSRETACALA
jgi:hypothetical protein